MSDQFMSDEMEAAIALSLQDCPEGAPEWEDDARMAKRMHVDTVLDYSKSVLDDVGRAWDPEFSSKQLAAEMALLARNRTHGPAVALQVAKNLQLNQGAIPPMSVLEPQEKILQSFFDNNKYKGLREEDVDDAMPQDGEATLVLEAMAHLKNSRKMLAGPIIEMMVLRGVKRQAATFMVYGLFDHELKAEMARPVFTEVEQKVEPKELTKDEIRHLKRSAVGSGIYSRNRILVDVVKRTGLTRDEVDKLMDAALEGFDRDATRAESERRGCLLPTDITRAILEFNEPPPEFHFPPLDAREKQIRVVQAMIESGEVEGVKVALQTYQNPLCENKGLAWAKVDERVEVFQVQHEAMYERVKGTLGKIEFQTLHKTPERFDSTFRLLNEYNEHVREIHALSLKYQVDLFQSRMITKVWHRVYNALERYT